MICYWGRLNHTYTGHLEHGCRPSKVSRECGEPEFVYPPVYDVSVVSKSDVYARLPHPISHEGTARVESHLSIPITLARYNIR